MRIVSYLKKKEMTDGNLLLSSSVHVVLLKIHISETFYTTVCSVQIVSWKFMQGIISCLSSFGMDGTSFTEPPPM